MAKIEFQNSRVKALAVLRFTARPQFQGTFHFCFRSALSMKHYFDLFDCLRTVGPLGAGLLPGHFQLCPFGSNVRGHSAVKVHVMGT